MLRFLFFSFVVVLIALNCFRNSFRVYETSEICRTINKSIHLLQSISSIQLSVQAKRGVLWTIISTVLSSNWLFNLASFFSVRHCREIILSLNR